MIYLASPYTHPDPAVREQRFEAACRAAAALTRAGHIVFSPVAHSHPIAQYGLPTDWGYWERTDRAFLERCDLLVVLMLDGWRESRGVAEEIGLAHGLGLPVRYLLPDRLEAGDTAVTLARVANEQPAGRTGQTAWPAATWANVGGFGRLSRLLEPS